MVYQYITDSYQRKKHLKVEMSFVRVHRRINQITELFIFIGLWHHGNDATVKEMWLQLIYFFYYLVFPILLFGGAIITADSNEIIILIEAQILTTVLLINLMYVIGRKSEILELLHEMCVHFVDDREEFIRIKEKLDKIMKFIVFWVTASVVAIFAELIAPVVSDDRKLFFNIAFPWDWKNDTISYWIAYSFIFTEGVITLFAILFSVIKIS